LIDSISKNKLPSIFRIDKEYIYLYKSKTDTTTINKFRVKFTEKRNKFTRFEIQLNFDFLGRIDYRYRILNLQDNLLLVELTSIIIDNMKQNTNIKFIYQKL